MTDPTVSGWYWAWETSAGSTRTFPGGGPEVMYWDAADGQWWGVGLDYALAGRGCDAGMHAWVGPLTPPEAPR